jgi:Replicative DNA helicase
MVGRGIRRQGFSNIDNITLDTYLADKPTLRRHYEELNGWRACKAMMDLVDPENTDSYYNQIAKMNTLKILATKYDELLSHPERFDDATNEDVYNTFELLNNSVALTTGNDSKIENLVVDEKYIQQCNAGMDQGISYAAGAPLLNYLTLGAPVGDMYLFAGHSGTGKSSFIFENMVLPFAEGGTGVAIISNEMQSKAY